METYLVCHFLFIEDPIEIREPRLHVVSCLAKNLTIVKDKNGPLYIDCFLNPCYLSCVNIMLIDVWSFRSR